MDDPVEVTDEEIEKRRKARVFFFVDDEATREFDHSYTMLLREMQKRKNSMYISENNVLHYSHGANWVRSARDDDEGLQMQTMSTEWLIPHQSIVDNDLSLITTGLQNTSESLSAQFAQSIFSVVGAAAEKVGNVVSDNETGSTAQSFLEMLKKVEFGVDRNGKVCLPQVHVGPDMFDKLVNALESQPPEFQEEVERVKAEGTALALRKEAERKARFKVAE